MIILLLPIYIFLCILAASSDVFCPIPWNCTIAKPGILNNFVPGWQHMRLIVLIAHLNVGLINQGPDKYQYNTLVIQLLIHMYVNMYELWSKTYFYAIISFIIWYVYEQIRQNISNNCKLYKLKSMFFFVFF